MQVLHTCLVFSIVEGAGWNLFVSVVEAHQMCIREADGIPLVRPSVPFLTVLRILTSWTWASTCVDRHVGPKIRCWCCRGTGDRYRVTAGNGFVWPRLFFSFPFCVISLCRAEFESVEDSFLVVRCLLHNPAGLLRLMIRVKCNGRLLYPRRLTSVLFCFRCFYV